MQIVKLIVKKTYPTEEIIREVYFNKKGVSLIVDETTNEPTDSGNSVGKSTVVKIIDLCLGGDNQNAIYFDSDTKNTNKEIKDLIINCKVRADLHLIAHNGSITIVSRDLFPNGTCFINNKPYSHDAFSFELKKLIFNSNEKKPTFRQLMPKFLRLNNSDDIMIKFLHTTTTNETYDTIYSFLFQLLDNKLLSRREKLNLDLRNCKSRIKALKQNIDIKSIAITRQQLESVERDLLSLTNARDKIPYKDNYREEFRKKGDFLKRIDQCEKNIDLVNYEINTIKTSIAELISQKHNHDSKQLEKIYSEVKNYIPSLQKTYTDMVNFHNTMIENRLIFIKNQLEKKEKIRDQYQEEIDHLIIEKQKLAVDILDDGVLDEYNKLSIKIEELAEKKGEYKKAITILDNEENNMKNLQNDIADIDSQIDEHAYINKINSFNQYFGDYCELLYGEKYVFAYDPDWKKSPGNKKFPVAMAGGSLGGNPGTGKKKAIIVAFDLAYMKYSEVQNIPSPRFVIHDKVENIYINQIKTIFNICKSINGQYIFPVIKERISGGIPSEEIEERTVLKLSSKDRFFRV